MPVPANSTTNVSGRDSLNEHKLTHVAPIMTDALHWRNTHMRIPALFVIRYCGATPNTGCQSASVVRIDEQVLRSVP